MPSRRSSSSVAQAATPASTVDDICGKKHFSSHDQCAGINIMRNMLALALRTHLMECHAEHARSVEKGVQYTADEARKCDAGRLVELLQMTKDETLADTHVAKAALAALRHEKHQVKVEGDGGDGGGGGGDGE